MENVNHLYCGDCKQVLTNLKTEGTKVDLIYLDPPFNSDQVYNMIYKSDTGKKTAQQVAFTDTWSPPPRLALAGISPVSSRRQKSGSPRPRSPIG